ncbi:hypothetical protein [Gallaecimonas sp. GXIMD4217]|uniref:hypothetical protein n=1 Tax=Gallaecimonas sp. GXIMD4217 TaxID=3131927 RepID=UPI00311B3D69
MKTTPLEALLCGQALLHPMQALAIPPGHRHQAEKPPCRGTKPRQQDAKPQGSDKTA